MKQPLSTADDIAHLTLDLGRFLRSRMMQSCDSVVHTVQAHALLFIQMHPGTTMKHLAAMMHVTSPSATTLVDRLVRLGLVQRVGDATNRRLVRLHITDLGSDSLSKTMSKRRKVLVDVLSGLSPAELDALKGIIQKILRSAHR